MNLPSYKLLFILLVLASIVLLYFYSIYYHSKSPDNLDVETLSINKLLKQCNNGDLLFFSGNTYGEKIIKWHTNSQFNHVSMVLRENDVPYVWEADLGQGYKQGPRVVMLEDKLKRWKGSSIVLWKKSLDPPSLKNILEIIPKYKNQQMDISMTSWLFSDDTNSSLYKWAKPQDSVYCSELILKTLRDLNIITIQKSPSYFSPQDILDALSDTKKELIFKVPYSKDMFVKIN